ncbi:MAG: YitT family protein [Mycoplasma sp.]|nr:YitT family protein [Mycoplasma sp.]
MSFIREAYWNRKQWLNIIILIIASFTYTFGLLTFLQPAGLFTTGLAVIPQLIVYATSLSDTWILPMYFALNIPLVIFSFWKIGKKFAVNTTIFLLFQLMFSLIFTEFTSLTSWNPLQSPLDSVGRVSDQTYKIVLNSIMAALFMGTGISFSFLAGGCTGGTDVITMYYSKRKRISIGKMSRTIALIIVFLAITILQIGIEKNSFKETYLGVRTSLTVLYIVISSAIINLIFPVFKKVNLIISSTKYKDIQNYLIKEKYRHAWLLTKAVGGYSKKENIRIETILYWVNTRRLINQIHTIDPNAWISVHPIVDIKGKLTPEID